jgi:hypothetical protein
MRAMAVEFPEVAGHPNRLPFEGCLTLVDVASDRAPSGARGHRVILTRAAAEAALPSLMGMAVDFKAGWDGHDARQKCGIITSAHLEDNKLMVAGYLYELRVSRCACGRHAGKRVDVDARDLYRRGDSAARQGRISRHEFSRSTRCQGADESHCCFAITKATRRKHDVCWSVAGRWQGLCQGIEVGRDVCGAG